MESGIIDWVLSKYRYPKMDVGSRAIDYGELGPHTLRRMISEDFLGGGG